MKLIRLTGVAWAQAQCCGVWLQYGSTIVGVFPNWWFGHDYHSKGPRTRRPFRLGLKLWAADRNGGVHSAFEIKTRRWSFGYKRAFSEPSTHMKAGWSFRRHGARTA